MLDENKIAIANHEEKAHRQVKQEHEIQADCKKQRKSAGNTKKIRRQSPRSAKQGNTRPIKRIL